MGLRTARGRLSAPRLLDLAALVPSCRTDSIQPTVAGGGAGWAACPLPISTCL